jgi:uncharacterized membrane protein YkoI
MSKGAGEAEWAFSCHRVGIGPAGNKENIMKKEVIISATVLAIAAGGMLSGNALAGQFRDAADDAEMQALASAKLSAADAIGAVLAEDPGKVSELQFNLEKDVPNYEISVLGHDGAEHDYAVNATTGTVMAITANEDAMDDDAIGSEKEDGDND